jgi:hypothetical protein
MTFCYKRHTALLFLACAFGFVCASNAYADPIASNASSVASSAEQSDSSNYNDGDFTRPETSAILRFEFRKSSTDTSETNREREILQYNSKLDLGYGWKLGTQVQLPVVEKSTATYGEPGLASVNGLGNAIFQAAFIRGINERWAFGFGARLVTLTQTNSVETDRWQIMPAVGVRYSFLEVNADTYFVPVVRYAISFGGSPTARTIREPEIAPTFNIGLPDRWFVTLYPSNDIRINFGTPISGQTGRLFLPFDAAVGRKFTNNLVISLEAAVPIVKDYPVYDFKSELKATWQF